MTIKDITFNDSDKNITIIIDGQPYEINVKTINKEDAKFVINKLNNTALQDDIIVDATLSPVEQAVITISLWNLDKTIQYYTANISTNDGHILHNIPNNLPIGQYLVTLEYAGNKYYNKTDISKQIEIKRREIFCDIESKVFYVRPNSTFTKTFRIVDKLNGKPINNCEISYVYKDEIFNIISNNNGYVNIEVEIPDTDKTHCTSNVLAYPIIFYLDDSESYSLKDTTIKLMIDKLDTELSANYANTDYGQIIQGHVISTNGYANYGIVDVSILKNYKERVNVDSAGYFETDLISIDDIIDQLHSDSEGVFTTSMDIPTVINIEGEKNISVGDDMRITATVQDNKGNIVVDGVVDFELYNNQNKLVYRYVDELDNSGQVIFIFYTSKKGKYHIKATYKSIIAYRSSESEEINITVGE